VHFQANQFDITHTAKIFRKGSVTKAFDCDTRCQR